MKRIIVCLAALFVAVSAHAQFDGAVGTPGCQAISREDSRIKSWAFGVEVQRGYEQNSTTEFVSYGKPYMAQGLPDGTTTTAVALGEGGIALITFEAPIIDGDGADFCVFENGFTSTYLEIAFVEVSSDGEHFYRFPATSYTTSSSLLPELMNNLAGKYEVGWGTPFDLAEINDDEFFDRNNVRFVRLVDVIGGVDTDSQGNIIYDALSGGWASGFDLTGVGVINQGERYKNANFEGLLSTTDSHELVSASNGTLDSDGNYRLSYLSGGLNFEALGLYDGMFACGFGPSNHTTSSQPYYSAQSLMGLEGPDSTYMVGYYSDWEGTLEHNVIKKEDNTAFSPIGVYVNNSSSSAAAADYSYMLSANFPQTNYFLNIIATGYDENGAVTNAVSYPLADANGIVAEWKYMDLTSLGECHKVIFSLSSNDDSGYGINVPAYFCIDAFTYYAEENTSSLRDELANEFSINVYPNPASERANINIKGLNREAQIIVSDMQGRIVWSDETFENNYELNTSNMQSGVYFIKITSENIVKTQKLIVR